MILQRASMGVNPDGVWASDQFGLCVDLSLPELPADVDEDHMRRRA